MQRSRQIQTHFVAVFVLWLMLVSWLVVAFNWLLKSWVFASCGGLWLAFWLLACGGLWLASLVLAFGCLLRFWLGLAYWLVLAVGWLLRFGLYWLLGFSWRLLLALGGIPFSVLQSSLCGFGGISFYIVLPQISLQKAATEAR